MELSPSAVKQQLTERLDLPHAMDSVRAGTKHLRHFKQEAADVLHLNSKKSVTKKQNKLKKQPKQSYHRHSRGLGDALFDFVYQSAINLSHASSHYSFLIGFFLINILL